MAFALVCCANTQSYAQKCKTLEMAEELEHSKTAYAKTFEKFCLHTDIEQRSVFDIHAGSFKSLAGQSLINIKYPQKYLVRNPWTWVTNPPLTPDYWLDLDLQEHELRGKVDNLVGIQADGRLFNIRIHNGKISVPGNRSINVGIEIISPNIKLKIDQSKGYKYEALESNEDTPAAATLDGKAPAYPTTRYLIEDMTIRAGWRGIVLGGGGNIIRNSTIEVDGHTALALFGPGSLIENNTIIIHGEGEAQPFDAPIKLRDAHGAIVRNNKIIFKQGWFSTTKAAAAINLLDSRDFVIEGNTVEAFDTLVRSNSDSSHSANNNVMK